MYNSQILSTRIRKMVKEKGFVQKEMLSSCELNENSLNQMSDKKGLSSFSLAKIADYLDCSVDYLLGRTENPQVNSSNHITTGNIQGDNNANISIGASRKFDDAQEILEMIQELSLLQRSKIVVMINEMKSEK